jgi:hypothetical protein
MILCVDPGIRGAGVALFEGETLFKAAYVRNPHSSGQGLVAQRAIAGAIIQWATLLKGKVCFWTGGAAFVGEWPQVYTASKSKGDPNTSLLPLCGVIAHISGAEDWDSRVEYKPREWKGTVDADVMTERIRSRLSEKEKAALEPCAASLEHNMIDAVGLGLHHLGRLERKRVFAR